MLKQTAVIGMLVLLSGCGTPEFRAEQNLCKTTWLAKIEPRFERELYNQSRSRQVPTGRTICKGSGNTLVCDQVMRTEYYTVPAVRTVDRNKPRRDAQIRQCTQEKCLQKFGNAKCEA